LYISNRGSRRRRNSSRFVREADRDSTMVTEDHRHAGRKKSKAEKIANLIKK
jgi:hypothetical protein